jgi:futalosine hydrolase
VRILIVAATSREIAPLVATLQHAGDESPRLTSFTCAGHEIDILQAGVGLVSTAVWCARALGVRPYALAVNVGVCGAFDPALAPGSVVNVVSEQLSELGAEDGEGFLTVQQLGLIGDSEAPFVDGRLVARRSVVNPVVSALPAVRGISVSTAHGNPRTIAEVVRRFDPQVESMEGAAFMYACLIADVPFLEIRGVSNRIERRNRAAWKMKEAVDNLANAVRRIIEAA